MIIQSKMETFIFDKIDRKEKEFIAKHGEAPSRILLDHYSYLMLAKELNKDLIEDDFRYLHDCYEIVVHGLTEDEVIEFIP